MASQRNTSIQGYTLPLNVDAPRTLCVTLKIPNDQWHVAAFIGAIFELTQWTSWQRDVGRKGRLAASVWRDIWDNIVIGQCSNAVGPVGVIEDFAMPIRVDCNCNVFATCCDGTEIQLATTKMLKQPDQPGAGSPQAPAGGGAQQTCTKLNARDQLLFPQTVSSGDVVVLDSAGGAAWDGSEFDLGPLWRCPDGGQFVGGLNVGFKRTVGTDPLPTAPHMSLILVVYAATTIYLALAVGAPVTIPVGVSNAQIAIQANTSNLATCPGSYDICATLTNNRAAPWVHDWDFTVSPGPWVVATGEGGQWLPGTGFSSTFVDPYQQAQITLTLPTGRAYTAWQMEYTSTVAVDTAFLQDVSTTTTTQTPTIGRNTIVFSGVLNPGDVLFAGVHDVSHAPGTNGQYVLTKIRITGTGSDPF